MNSSSLQTPPDVSNAPDDPKQPPPPTSQPSQPSLEPSPELMQQAAANDRKRSFHKMFKNLLSIATFIATVVIAAALINQFIFQSYYVEGSSMIPTLKNEDRLIIGKVDKTIAHLQGKTYLPARGDIVILDSSILDQYGHQEQLIKRIVGLPGDTVVIHNGEVIIKNPSIPAGFNIDKKLGLQLEPTYSETPIELTIPEGYIYVLGDNRGINGSFDSRIFGPTSTSNIQGRLVARIFPFDQTRAF